MSVMGKRKLDFDNSVQAPGAGKLAHSTRRKRLVPPEVSRHHVVLLALRRYLELSEMVDLVWAFVGETEVISTHDSFAALLKPEGRVVLWGNSAGCSESSQLNQGVEAIYSTTRAFAAKLDGGGVVTWGPRNYGGNSSSVQKELKGVSKIYSNSSAFAAILDSGKVITWGHGDFGGNSDQIQNLLIGVSTIHTTERAFAAILHSGDVVTWGDTGYGGDSANVQPELKGVSRIYSTLRAFTAVLNDGQVITWGDPLFGGNSHRVQSQLTGVVSIQSTSRAFAAILDSGRVVTWGNSEYGGNSAEVQPELKEVCAIYSTLGAFAALLDNGHVVTWGCFFFGGHSLHVQKWLTNVITICSTRSAFAARLYDGRVISWGDLECGGRCSESTGESSDLEPLRGIGEVYSTLAAFAAIEKDGGKLVTWGIPQYGGDRLGGGFRRDRLEGVETLYSNDSCFSAVMTNGDIIYIPTYGECLKLDLAVEATSTYVEEDLDFVGIGF
jgi:hypothetical protein